MASSLRARLEEIYHPRPAPWKRPVLLWLSVAILALCALGGSAQIEYHWTNNGVWLVIGLFGVLSVTGVGVALFGDDWWVALVLGAP